MQDTTHGYGEMDLDTGEWVEVFAAGAAFDGAVRSVACSCAAASASPMYVYPQHDGSIEPDGGTVGTRIEPGYGEEFSAANRIKGRVVSLWVRSAGATVSWGVTLP